MLGLKQETIPEETLQEEQEIGLLKEWLPKISGECRAFLKGASQALLYAQEEPEKTGIGSLEKPSFPRAHTETRRHSGHGGEIGFSNSL